jgi:hypothetical protein
MVVSPLNTCCSYDWILRILCRYFRVFRVVNNYVIDWKTSHYACLKLNTVICLLGMSVLDKLSYYHSSGNYFVSFVDVRRIFPFFLCKVLYFWVCLKSNKKSYSSNWSCFHCSVFNNVQQVSLILSLFCGKQMMRLRSLLSLLFNFPVSQYLKEPTWILFVY